MDLIRSSEKNKTQTDCRVRRKASDKINIKKYMWMLDQMLARKQNREKFTLSMEIYNPHKMLYFYSDI